VAKELVRELINAGVHFGHGASRWNPKMAPFIFAKRGNIHIIDVKKTLKGLLIAKRLLASIVGSGKDVVFVGTKRQAQETVQTVAKKCGMHYVSNRWLGGTLTNFRTIRSRLQRLEELEAMKEQGLLESQSKKQASRLKREMRKIQANLEGIRNMNRLPGVVVAVDARKEYLALHEARKMGIGTVALIDTDSNPDTVDVAIPANDDSIRGIELILNELAEAVAVGKTRAAVMQTEVDRPVRHTRSRRPALARADGGKPSLAVSEEDSPPATAETTPEQAVLEQAGQEQPAPQQAGPEQSGPEQAVPEQAGQDQAALEQPAPQQADPEQTGHEQPKESTS